MKNTCSKKLYLILLIIYHLSIITCPSYSSIITVKQDGTGDFIRIQDAINAAEINDTVLVWPGIYYENLHIAAKPITLASLYFTTGDKLYISQTVIDGSTQEKAVIFCENYPTDSFGVIVGLTIKNGIARVNPSYMSLDGGGILLSYAGSKIVNCIISNNKAYKAGGGIAAWYSDMILKSNSIKDNVANWIGGGYLDWGRRLFNTRFK